MIGSCEDRLPICKSSQAKGGPFARELTILYGTYRHYGCRQHRIGANIERLGVFK